ncbi:MAG: cobalt-precorrin-5B (C(1))-methyltransferase CbiD [Methanobacteriaceae archaeon]|nr:cobalt-precorrin-5B (C(1))-methyltransferase CbiD [Methanobacteriaceae archaeon]
MVNFNESPRKEFDFGITTGTAATAAALAAFLAIKNKDINFVDIITPVGTLKIEVSNSKKLNQYTGTACVLKKPYKDPDVTTNMEICARVKIIEKGIIIKGGKGVGTVTKPGLQVPVGQPAINPAPMDMIRENLNRVLKEDHGIEVEICVPQGEKIAQKTMNPRLGIVGGISILGTTGIARPMSSKAYKESLNCQIDVALAQGYNDLIFVPGNIGQKLALNILNAEEDQIVQMGNFVGYMLEQASVKGVKRIILLGHAGKLVKIAAGIFNTKNSIADGRAEVIASYAGLKGAPKSLIKRILESKTTEDMIEILEENNLVRDVFNSIADSIKYKCKERFSIDLEVIIVRMDGTILNNI